MRQENRRGTAQTGTIAEAELLLAKPSMYKVMLLNDDYTPMEFVAFILQKFFHKSQTEAVSLTNQINAEGAAVCGFYTRDVAETKSGFVNDFSRRNQHPLKCTFEEEF
jgi:ATP-dependent Clp protease adaptor protein ClpS